MNKDCILTIKNKYNTLTKVEMKIADYILENSENLVNMPVSSLAKNAGVAESAIVRFSKEIGFSGFRELKLSLALERSKNKKLNFTPYISPKDTSSEILDKIFSANVKTLHDTAEKIDRKIIDKVVNILYKAENIYVYAVGTSSALAQDFCYRLMQLGFRSFCYTDVASMKISTLNTTKNDVAFGISHSGRTMPTIDALNLSKERGTKTICLTGFPDSLITKISDYTLNVYSDEIEYPMEAISARISQISLLDAIAVSLSSKNYEKTKERSKCSHELVNSIRYEEKKYEKNSK